MNWWVCSRGQQFGINSSTNSFQIAVLKGSECNPEGTHQISGLEYIVVIHRVLLHPGYWLGMSVQLWWDGKYTSGKCKVNFTNFSWDSGNWIAPDLFKFPTFLLHGDTLFASLVSPDLIILVWNLYLSFNPRVIFLVHKQPWSTTEEGNG